MTEKKKENKDHGIWSHHFMANRWGSKITADGDCSHEIKRHLKLKLKVKFTKFKILFMDSIQHQL